MRPKSSPASLFIVGGQKAYVAEVGEKFINPQGRRNARLRLIFDNGTESRVLLRSFQRALNKDEAGRRITEPEVGPLFDAPKSAEGTESGTIYVLRSKSDHPLIVANRDLVHKIGVTAGMSKAGSAIRKSMPTYLLADVEVVATYTLHQHQSREAREPTPPHFRAGTTRDRNRRSVRHAGQTARMVPRAAHRHRRGGGADPGRVDCRFRL